jgi:outer membrane receptor protein involved in Fe transport
MAENLIQLVRVGMDSVPILQYQNVGRIKNTGVELEGGISIGKLQLTAQYGYASSVIKALPANYSGDLRLGDQTFFTPKNTAGASASITSLAETTIAANLTYVGSWNYYDIVSEYRCLGGTGPCRSTPRDYIIAYPSFVKLNATISRQFNRLVTGFISIDNLTNNEASELYNFVPPVGRTTTAGLRLKF